MTLGIIREVFFLIILQAFDGRHFNFAIRSLWNTESWRSCKWKGRIANKDHIERSILLTYMIKRYRPVVCLSPHYCVICTDWWFWVSEHLLLQCPVALAVWKRVFKKFARNFQVIVKPLTNRGTKDSFKWNTKAEQEFVLWRNTYTRELTDLLS